MRTLGAWIAGVFALGLLLGSFVSGSGAVPELAEPDLEAALDATPGLDRVDCGEGREALLEPVAIDGTTSFKVRCVPIEAVERHEPARLGSRPAPVVATAPPPPAAEPPVVTPATPPTSEPVEANVEDGEGRSWKESAAVIGGAAGAGAGIGAIAKGKKGAAVGAAIGAASGAAYELIKRDKKN